MKLNRGIGLALLCMHGIWKVKFEFDDICMLCFFIFFGIFLGIWVFFGGVYSPSHIMGVV